MLSFEGRWPPLSAPSSPCTDGSSNHHTSGHTRAHARTTDWRLFGECYLQTNQIKTNNSAGVPAAACIPWCMIQARPDRPNPRRRPQPLHHQRRSLYACIAAKLMTSAASVVRTTTRQLDGCDGSVDQYISLNKYLMSMYDAANAIA